MKNLKIIRTLIVIFIALLLIGCSDQLTSSGESENFEPTKSTGKGYIPEVDMRLSIDKFFRIQIVLKPYRSYTFNASNTGFVEFNSINIKNLSLPLNIDPYTTECHNIFVYGNTLHECIVLGCDNKEFNVKEITIENLGSEMIDLNVSLGGVKKKYTIPVGSE